jgi:tripartite ATP-independent transporter DctM subunit
MADIRGEPPAPGGAGSDTCPGVTPALGRGLDTLLASGVEAATVVAMLLQVGSVAAGVFCRYVLHRPLAGADEVATLGLVWLTFLGGAVAQRRHAHPRVSLGVRRLASAAWVDASTRLVEIGFFAGVCWQSLRLCRLRLGEASAGIGFDMSLYPLAVLFGVTATGLFAIGHLATLPWRVLRAVLAGAGGLGVGGALLLHLTGGQFPHLPTTGMLLVGFLGLLVLNAPLAVALGFPALVALQGLGGAHLLMLPQRLIAGVDNFVLLAIPLFLLAGALMETGGISRRLVALALALVGHFRGGLAHVTVVGEILFSGISGSTTADVAVLAALLLPAMEREGYRRAEAVAIVSAAAAMGILVPPCLLMVLLATIANLSVTALFLAGFLPAATLAGVLMLLIALQAWRQQWPVCPRASWGSLGQALRAALLPLLLPVLVFGSIFTGVATVTESAVLAVLYAWMVGACVYRETPWRAVPRLCLESGIVSAVSLWLIASASVFTWLLAREQVPQLVASALLTLSSQPWFFLLASLVLFTSFAALLEGLPAVIILGPLFYPLAAQMGVSALHFSILIVACVGIGLFLPPVGVGLLIACSMARATVPSVMGTVSLYLGVLLVGLLLVAFVPWITLVLPTWLLGQS